MDEPTRQWHLRAGRAAGRESTCGTKIDYKSESTATKLAAHLNARGDRRNVLEAYPCFWCTGWHLGRKMTPEA